MSRGVLAAATPPLLLLLLLAGRQHAAAGFGIERHGRTHVIGYLPEYRHGYDLEAAVDAGFLSGVVLFSVEVLPGGGIQGSERLLPKARAAKLQAAGVELYLCVGGAGRSDNFRDLGDARARRRTVSALLELVRGWRLDGIDIDWESPSSAADWKVLGNLVVDIRKAWRKKAGEDAHRQELVVSFTLWPHAIQGMLAAKSGGSRTLVDVADRVHLMAYGMDESEMVRKWEGFGLPAERLVLGVPFFGQSKKGILPYYDLPAASADAPATAASLSVGGMRLAAELAAEHQLAGLFVWEVGSDRHPTHELSLLRALAGPAWGEEL